VTRSMSQSAAAVLASNAREIRVAVVDFASAGGASRRLQYAVCAPDGDVVGRLRAFLEDGDLVPLVRDWGFYPQTSPPVTTDDLPSAISGPPPGGGVLPLGAWIPPRLESLSYLFPTERTFVRSAVSVGSRVVVLPGPGEGVRHLLLEGDPDARPPSHPVADPRLVAARSAPEGIVLETWVWDPRLGEYAPDPRARVVLGEDAARALVGALPRLLRQAELESPSGRQPPGGDASLPTSGGGGVSS
jgi:hypothetical protein